MSEFESETLIKKKQPFEKQFALVEKHNVAGGTVEVVDIYPGIPKSDVPVLIAPAWGCTTLTYKEAIRTLIGLNRRVIALNHSRLGGKVIQGETDKNYPPEQLRKARNIIGVLEQKGIKKTDVIAHSEGAVNVAIAATLYPEKFRNIVFFGPAGLMGHDSFIRLLKGFSKQKGVTATAAREAIKYFRSNPIRGIKEAVDLAGSQIHDMLPGLLDKGVGIIIISGMDDPAFPMERMQKIVKADMVDGFLSVRGGHGEIGDHPERYMTAAESMLTALETKSGGGSSEPRRG